MAEFVHQTLEEMLPELEEMIRSDLFTEKETKIILKKREALEYRLRQRTKTRGAYLNYIEYEEKLLELIKMRKMQNGDDNTKRQVQNSIIDRIHSLHRFLTTRFSEDVALWERHIQFCIAMKQTSYVSRLYNKILRIHSHKDDIWVKAARFERSPEGNGNPEAARELLLKGQRVLPESQAIYLEMYHMELDLATTILRRKKVLKISDDLASDDEMEGGSTDTKELPEFKLASIVYRKSLEIFPNNPKFHLKILGVCSEFKLAAHQMKTILADLEQLYPDTPEVWNGLALCQLNKYHKMKVSERKMAANRCLQTFRRGLQRIPRDTKIAVGGAAELMWSYCLRGHLAVLKLRHGNTDATQILTTTVHLFQDAINACTLNEDLCQYLISMLTDMDLHEDAGRVAEKVVQLHPASAGLWLEHLRAMTERGVAFDDVIAAFRTAVRNVKPETSWALWQFVLHLSTVRDNSCLEALMEEGCRSVTPQVCMPAKEWSLEWTYRQGGIKKARQVYRSLKSMRPVSVEFYRRYIHIEHSQPEPNLDLMRNAFEEALAEFGQSEQGVWLNYMEMETTVAKDAVKAGVVKQRALQSLRPDLKESFVRTNALIGLAA